MELELEPGLHQVCVFCLGMRGTQTHPMLRLHWPPGSLPVQSGLLGVTLGRKGEKVMKSGHLYSIAHVALCQWPRSVALICGQYEAGSTPVLRHTCCRRSNMRHLVVGTGGVHCLCPPRQSQTARPETCFHCSVCRGGWKAYSIWATFLRLSACFKPLYHLIFSSLFSMPRFCRYA